LLRSIDSSYALDDEAEEQMLHLADAFLTRVTEQGMKMARHRGSDKLDARDLALVLKKQWGVVVPGLLLGGGSEGGAKNGLGPVRTSRVGGRAIAGGVNTSSSAVLGSSSGGVKRRMSNSSIAGGGARKKRASSVTGSSTNAAVGSI